MNTELLLTLLNPVNAIFCLIIIGLSIWHNAQNKVHSNTFIGLIIVLLILLIGQIISSTQYEAISLLLSLFILLILVLKYNKLKSVQTVSNNTHSDELINQAKEQERSRIYANLHDDVGAKLLELIYTAKDDESKNLAKQVLNDIRQAVASTVNVQCNVNQLSNEIIEESEMRLKTAAIALIKNKQLTNPQQYLSAAVPIVIGRICREIISNIIKHSQANQVEMSIHSTDKNLNITISDNGIGILDKDKSGKGLKTVNKRAQSISSVVEWTHRSNNQTNKGTQFSLTYNYGNH